MKNLLFTIILLFTFSIIANAQSVNIVSATNPMCQGLANGSITVQALGMTPPVNFVIYPNPSTPTINTTFNGLGAGVYTIQATDALLWTSTATAILVDPPVLSLSIINVTNPTCGQCNGTALFTGTGGTPPYTFSTGPTSNVVNGFASTLCQMIYTVVVIDANNCTSMSALNNIGSTPPNLTLSGDSIICGIAQPLIANLQGATTTVTYTLQPGNISNNTGIFNLVASNTYTITGVDANLCSTSTVYTSNPTLVSNALTGVLATSNSYDENCNFSNDGGIDVQVSPSAGLNYLWNSSDTTQDLLNLSSGNYWVKISNSIGDCIYLYDTVNIVGLNCGSISGFVYRDSANNCIFDSGDYYLSNIPISLSTGANAITNAGGYYEFSQVPFGTHIVTQNSIYTENSCVQGGSIILNSSVPIINNHNFKDSINSYLNLGVYLYANPFLSFFGNSNYFLLLSNNYTDSVNVILTLKLDTIVSYAYSNINPTTITTNLNVDSLTWAIKIPPGFSNISVNVIYPTNTPANTILNPTATISSVSIPDTFWANNISSWFPIMLNSWDPNDKNVSPRGEGLAGNITVQDSILSYLIRFQNTGNFAAQNVIVMDTLSDKLDINSLEVISASHDYTLEILNGNVLKYNFINIQLPDSNSNEPASHGNIYYQIKQKNTNQLGDEIKNSASIYFDFNAPIITNSTLNTIYNTTKLNSFTNNNQIQIFPNPTKDVLVISLNSTQTETINYEIINLIGDVILENNLEIKNGKAASQIIVKDIPNGIYILKINVGKNIFVEKIIKN